MLESNKIFEIVFCRSISLQEKLSPEGQEALTVAGRVRLRRERLRRARLRRARLRRERLLRRRRRRRRQPCDSEAVDSPRAWGVMWCVMWGHRLGWRQGLPIWTISPHQQFNVLVRFSQFIHDVHDEVIVVRGCWANCASQLWIGGSRAAGCYEVWCEVWSCR